jgi:hypothetical protein
VGTVMQNEILEMERNTNVDEVPLMLLVISSLPIFDRCHQIPRRG